MTPPAPGPRFVVLTGLSGAGKTQALATFEDAGYFCIDNLPPQLVPLVVDLFEREGSKVRRAALVCDARGGDYFSHFEGMLDLLERRGTDFRLVFLEASDDVLVRRFKETRRRHPLATDGPVSEGITAERALLAPLRERAALVIDTGDLSIRQLRQRLDDELIRQGESPVVVFTFISFGYKYGVPIDADLLFDVRFLPNPYWETDLRPLTGRDAGVRDFVLASDGFREYMRRLESLLDFVFPRYADEGKTHLTVGIGCTGGRHRSVTIADHLAERYRGLGFNTAVRHRDIARD